ncbi:MAG: hypothetical protein ACKO68_06785 [Bacteroidota bacterium]
MSWNKHNINNLLLNPSLVKSADIDQLQQLCLDYPYAGLFALTYLEALHHNADIRLPKELPKYAYLVSDRTRLYHLLHDATIEFTPPLTELETEKDEVNQPMSVEPELPELHTLDPVKEETASASENGQSSLLEKDPLEQLIRESVASTRYVLEMEASEQEMTLDKVEKEENVPVEQTKSEESKSFTDWLGDVKMDKSATVADIPVERPPVDFYSPVKKAKESVNAENIPVSETLAKIFVIQGNYPKAVQIYEQLILTFPEKKAYFAGQIKKLTKKEA